MINPQASQNSKISPYPQAKSKPTTNSLLSISIGTDIAIQIPSGHYTYTWLLICPKTLLSHHHFSLTVVHMPTPFSQTSAISGKILKPQNLKIGIEFINVKLAYPFINS